MGNFCSPKPKRGVTISVEHFSELEMLYPMKLINKKHFLCLRKIPRSSDNVPFVTFSDDLRQKSSNPVFIVFISHRWWAGLEVPPHPDKGTVKFQLLKKAIVQLQCSLGDSVNILIWIDFFGIDQDDSKKKMLGIQSLPSYIHASDCLITPFTDTLFSEKWEPQGPSPLAGATVSDWAASFQSLADLPSQYFGRSWCRLEMYLAANAPLPELGFNYFQTIGCHRQGRPHFLVGDARDGILIPLPHLSNSFFKKLNPSTGEVQDYTDLEHIKALVDANPMKEEVVGYQGDMVDGKKHGNGTMIDEYGNKFTGKWENDKRNGKGIEYYCTGNMYEGDWVDNIRHGKGKYSWVGGNVYEGEYANGKKHGKGTILYQNGDKYKGDFVNNKEHGHGIFVTASGEKFEGRFVNGKRVKEEEGK